MHAETLRSASGGTGPRTLPYRIPDFVGRERELGQVLDALRGGATVLVHGMAGVGKTALAVHAGHEAAARFPDGQLFVDLHGYSPSRAPLPPATALAALLAQLEVPRSRLPDDLDGRAALWRAHTAGRRLLVVLDNAAGAVQLRPLLPGTPSAAVLATSRRRLTAVDGAQQVPLGVMPDGDAEALFAAVSGRPGAGAARGCGGLPLAVRIAAARFRNHPWWTTADLGRRLGDQRSRLAEFRTSDRDLSAVFALSYRELAPAQQRMFRLLGVHPGTHLTVPAAAALADAAATDAEVLLEELHDAHLLDQESRSGYTLHDLLAEHARSLTMPGERSAALDRLLGYYSEGGDAEWHARERPNLRAVVEHALEHQRHDQAWCIADHAARYLRAEGYRDDFLAVALDGLTGARAAGETHGLVRSLDNVANAHWESCELELALSAAEEWWRLARTTDDTVSRASSLSRIGTLHSMSGDYQRAVGYYRASLAENAPDPALTALVLGNLSHAQEMLGDLGPALDSASRARELREQTADEHGWVLSTAQLSLVLARLGRIDEALSAIRATVDTAERLAIPFCQAWARTDCAEILLMAGRPAEAQEQAERACALLIPRNHPLMLTLAANVLGDACRALGRPRLALDHYRVALDNAERLGFRRQQNRARAGYDDARAALRQ
ncbi:tetratricopeptide repeat protein [Amycolatopsis vastitatis]|uniref:tetratricopeptide repeat protein n=1 Tax=Amycolatopsis vastitatis TaxID=1905142 RepID=UPI001F0A7CEB|nr:tetratricopeptide repeat protein [Amycolatopsis vastitatis]